MGLMLRGPQVCCSRAAQAQSLAPHQITKRSHRFPSVGQRAAASDEIPSSRRGSAADAQPSSQYNSTLLQRPSSSSSPSSGSAVSDSLPSFEFVCPICNTTPFTLRGQPKGTMGLTCGRCSRTFNADSRFVDLTLTSGIKKKAFQQKEWFGTELFRSPVLSFVYERGWRQSFQFSGFPGVDKEADMALDYLKPAYGEVLVDMSCGSGLFSRKFVESGRFKAVIAADFSETMLDQTKAFFQEGGARSTSTPWLLLRADVGRLPFATGSVSAIHAGAAIHCWPNAQAALAEISRVLKPGGVLVGTTFMKSAAPLGELLGNDELVRPLNEGSTQGYRWWEEAELSDICASVGLQNFTRQRQFRFIMFSARKPEAQPVDAQEQ